MLELLERRVAVGEDALAVLADDRLEGAGEDREGAQARRGILDHVAAEVGEGDERARARAAGDREVDEDLDRRAGVAHAVGVRAHLREDARQLLRQVADLDRAVEREPALDPDLAGPGPALLAEAVPVVDPLGEVVVGVGEGVAAAVGRVGDLVEVRDQDGVVDPPVLACPLAQAREIGVVGVDREEADEASVLMVEVLVGPQALGDPTDGLAP